MAVTLSASGGELHELDLPLELDAALAQVFLQEPLGFALREHERRTGADFRSHRGASERLHDRPR